MSGKTYYEILEVARNASPEMISTAYRVKCERIKAEALRNPDAAAALRMAADEAYKTLTNAELRKRYDQKIALREQVAAQAVPIEDDRSWLARNVGLVGLAFACAVGGYLYYRHVQAERVAAQKLLMEKEERLAKAQADREQLERERAEAEAARKKKQEDAAYIRWVEQTRRTEDARARTEQAKLQRAEYEAKREADRQRRVEEMERRREETAARARLEQEKRRLQDLERQNYGYRRY